VVALHAFGAQGMCALMRSDQAPEGGSTVDEPVTPTDSSHPLAGKRAHPSKRTRIGGVWVAAAIFAVILLLLLIFILQNSEHVRISYLGAHGHLPLGVALILAAVCGVLLVVIPGTWRIVQLRRTRRKQHRS
jgi:uncharacterized integral membrane protein